MITSNSPTSSSHQQMDIFSIRFCQSINQSIDAINNKGLMMRNSFFLIIFIPVTIFQSSLDSFSSVHLEMITSNSPTSSSHQQMDIFSIHFCQSINQSIDWSMTAGFRVFVSFPVGCLQFVSLIESIKMKLLIVSIRASLLTFVWWWQFLFLFQVFYRGWIVMASARTRNFSPSSSKCFRLPSRPKRTSWRSRRNSASIWAPISSTFSSENASSAGITRAQWYSCPLGSILSIHSHSSILDIHSHSSILSIHSHSSILDIHSHNSILDSHSHSSILDIHSHSSILDGPSSSDGSLAAK